MSKKKHFQCQIIYVTNQDKRDVVFVIVIFTLKKLLAHAVPQDSEQNHEVKENGNSDEVLCSVSLEEISAGT